jgi:hypothetical protein
MVLEGVPAASRLTARKLAGALEAALKPSGAEKARSLAPRMETRGALDAARRIVSEFGGRDARERALTHRPPFALVASERLFVDARANSVRVDLYVPIPTDAQSAGERLGELRRELRHRLVEACAGVLHRQQSD